MFSDVLNNKYDLLVWVFKIYVLLLEKYSLLSNKCEWNLIY